MAVGATLGVPYLATIKSSARKLRIIRNHINRQNQFYLGGDCGDMKLFC